MNTKKIFSNDKVPSYVALLAATAALVIRAFYSFCQSDESFYFSTADRFLKGDLIFVHEWFPTQLVSLILMPFQWIYIRLTGGNDGVILYFRLLYVVLSLIFCFTIFYVIQKYRGNFAGLICALFCMFYVHLNIATLSYYSLSFFFFLTSMLVLYDGIKSDNTISDEAKSNNTMSFIASGFLFALAVLSLPSLAAVYFICAAGLVISSLNNTMSRKIFVYTLIGILIPAVLVLMYVLPTSGLFGILNNLKYVLSDEEHTTSLVYPFKNFFISVYNVYGRWPVYLTGLLSVSGFIYRLPEKFTHMLPDFMKSAGAQCRQRFSVYFEAAYFMIDLLLLLLHFGHSAGHTGFAATTLLLFAMPLFFITPFDRRDHLMFALIFMGGMIFSMVYSYSSLCDLYVLSVGHNVAAVAGICFILDYLRFVNNRYLSIISVALLLALLLQTMTLRFVNVYRDAPLNMLTATITQGPAMGLHTTPAHKAEYDAVLSVIKKYDRPGKNIFISKLLPWGYMATDMTCGAPTTWRTKMSSDRLRLYYEAHPERFPDVIIVLNNTIASYDSCGDVEADPAPNENEIQGYLLDKITERNYNVISTDIGTVYVSE